MKRYEFILFILGFVFNKAYSSEPLYDIKAYDGTYFTCYVGDGKSYPSICFGIVLDGDSTLLDIDSGESFYRSLFQNAKFVRSGELTYALAYNIIFPAPEGDYNNFDIAFDLCVNFHGLLNKMDKEERFKLLTGKDVILQYSKVKGLFLSIYDSTMSEHFSTSLDVPERLLPPLESVNIPIAVFNCTQSDHKFLIKGDTGSTKY